MPECKHAKRGPAPKLHACFQATLCSVCVIVLSSGAARAQEQPSAEQMKISVITFGRGDNVHQYFGHNAFVVSSPEMPPAVFNYGMFTFGPDMVANFLKGRLRFWMGATDLRRTAATYASNNRDVRIRDLNLAPAARLSIYTRLIHDAKPENREYLYDHYYDNCSTRLRDILDQALGGQLRRTWAAPSRFTLRQETRRYTQHDILTEWLMMFGLNGSVDRPQTRWGDAFLPDEFERLLETTSYRNGAGEVVPLVSAKHDLFLARRMPVPAVPATRWPYTFAIGLALGAIPLILVRQYQRSARHAWRVAFAAFAAVYGLLAGAIGTLLTSLWLFSDHLVSHQNLNLLLANPLALIAAGVAIAVWSRPRAERVLGWLWSCIAITTFVLLLIEVFAVGAHQDVSLTATLLAPANSGLALACRRLWFGTLSRAPAGTLADTPLSRSVFG
jgi:hypothetical protein